MRSTLADARTLIGVRGPMTVLVAVSGGADSMALLGLLERVAHADALRLVVGHVDHGLRASAAAEAELVLACARARGFAHACTRITLAAGPGLPARARTSRRAALVAQAQSVDAHVIALGHTASDQAETVLLHLVRGAGPDGLAGMAPVEPWMKCWVARPLLHLTRAETRELAPALGLPFVDDPTNEMHEHPRVRVRTRVIAELRALNPQVELRIAGAARSVRLERERDGSCAPSLVHDEAGAPMLDAKALRSLPSGARRHALRKLCTDGGVPADALPERTIAAIDRALARGLARRRWDLHRHALHLGDGRLWVTRADGNAAQEGPNH
jgi:tRNA(Ile)-lysidine synthase